MNLDYDPSRFFKSTTFEEIHFSEGIQESFTTFILHFKAKLINLEEWNISHIKKCCQEYLKRQIKVPVTLKVACAFKYIYGRLADFTPITYFIFCYPSICLTPHTPAKRCLGFILNNTKTDFTVVILHVPSVQNWFRLNPTCGFP